MLRDYYLNVLGYSCQNDAPKCQLRAKEGKCQSKPDYFLKACQKACGSCTIGG